MDKVEINENFWLKNIQKLKTLTNGDLTALKLYKKL